MKLFNCWPRVCLRCGSLDHNADECPMPAMMGMSDQEREHAIETRRGAQSLMLLIAFMALAHIGVALWFGVEP